MLILYRATYYESRWFDDFFGTFVNSSTNALTSKRKVIRVVWFITFRFIIFFSLIVRSDHNASDRISVILYDLSWLIISFRYDYDDLHGEVFVRSQVSIRFPLITMIWWFSVQVEWRSGDYGSVTSMHRRRTRTLASLKMIPGESSWRSCETSLDAKVTTYYKNPLLRSKTNNLTSSCYRFDYLRRSSDIDKSNWWISEDRAENLIDTMHWLNSVTMKTDFLTEAIKDTTCHTDYEKNYWNHRLVNQVRFVQEIIEAASSNRCIW